MKKYIITLFGILLVSPLFAVNDVNHPINIDGNLTALSTHYKSFDLFENTVTVRAWTNEQTPSESVFRIEMIPNSTGSLSVISCSPVKNLCKINLSADTDKIYVKDISDDQTNVHCTVSGEPGDDDFTIHVLER